MSKVKEYQVETIVDTLCTNMLSDKEQLRDISSIGLKTVIGELPPASSGKQECFFLLFPFYKWRYFSSTVFFFFLLTREGERYLSLKDLCKKKSRVLFLLKNIILIEFKYLFGIPVLKDFYVGIRFYIVLNVTCRIELSQPMQWEKR